MPRQASDLLSQEKENSPKKFTIWQTNYTHLKNSKINEAFRNYN